MKDAKKAEWMLRIAVFGTFLGHGVFALLVKQSWIPYFTGIGISESAAMTLLPLIGIMDIVVAIIALVRPLKVVLIWATAWALVTALIRPITGDPIWDFIERTANWAAPLALLMLQGLPKKLRDLWKV